MANSRLLVDLFLLLLLVRCLTGCEPTKVIKIIVKILNGSASLPYLSKTYVETDFERYTFFVTYKKQMMILTNASKHNFFSKHNKLT